MISSSFISSNSLSWIAPSSANALIAGALEQVIQLIWPKFRNASIRALVIITRSPTITTSFSPKRSRTLETACTKASGSAVFPLKTSIDIGRPSLSVIRPYSIWVLDDLWSLEYP